MSLRAPRPAAALLALAAALTGLAFVDSPRAPSPREQDTELQSQAIAGNLHFVAYLPSGYDTGATRYPVIYLLHGLPANATGYRGVGFDSRFRTIASRRGRALIGVSAGGYGAMHIALNHLDQFAVVESWSGYFHPTDPTGTQSLDLGSASANAAANVHRQLQASRRRLKALHTFIAFYVGRGDTRFLAENEQLNYELARAKIPHTFRLYPGGHDQTLWQTYAAPWLSLALAHLDPASG